MASNVEAREMLDTVEIQGVTYWTTRKAAQELGLTADRLRRLRYQEGAKHPKHVTVGNVTLYERRSVLARKERDISCANA